MDRISLKIVMPHIWMFFCVFVIGMLTTSCSKSLITGSPLFVPDGKYDIAFPYGGDADVLHKLLESVRLINSTAYYENYTFAPKDQIGKSDITPELLKSNRFPKTVFNDFAVGTATIIYAKNKYMAVLTCAHVVDFKDTLYTYHQTDPVENSGILSSISIKKRQTHYLVDIPHGENFKVLAMDRSTDLVIMGKKFPTNPSKPFPVFDYPLGSAGELDWGTFVYVIGFPSGKKMMTTGIVSSPNRDIDHDFLLDALFNRGFSGGIVLAIRDGLPHFELVGLVNAVAADNEIVLVPREIGGEVEFNFNLPYTGTIYASPRKKINYGISYGISIESVKRFMQRNKKELEKAGYEYDQFFKQFTREQQ